MKWWWWAKKRILISLWSEKKSDTNFNVRLREKQRFWHGTLFSFFSTVGGLFFCICKLTNKIIEWNCDTNLTWEFNDERSKNPVTSDCSWSSQKVTIIYENLHAEKKFDKITRYDLQKVNERAIIVDRKKIIKTRSWIQEQKKKLFRVR